ncbi:hypothetical protein [Leptolyngbya sp. O-77]|uniref:hypothetical protein n=1 Tax=Leptolyngbya sp. O-77 TaxID=1080068 RepID=UPI00074D2ED8|nr:hypothetical protein [Leptolyngbya sp. O-77]BAU45063.1 hypothetical protein O77CONTIG1_04912 [Leptolyngbya sp. O-77]
MQFDMRSPFVRPVTRLKASGFLLILMFGNLNWAAISPAQAQPQTAPTSAAFCLQEREIESDRLFFSRMRRLEADLSADRQEAASDQMIALIKLISTLPAPQKSLRLAGLITEDPGYNPNPWQTLIQKADERDRPDLVLPMLAEAVREVRTLGAGYSFLKSQTLLAIARAYLTLDQFEAAAATLNLAAQAVQTVQGDEFKVNALVPIADAAVSAGRAEQAIALLNQANRHARAIVHPNPMRRSSALAKVATSYAKAGQPNVAQQIVQELGNVPYAQGQAWLEIVRMRLTQNQFEEAAANARDIADPSARAIALAEVASGYTARNLAGGETLFQEAVTVAKSVNDTEFTLETVVNTYAAVRIDPALAVAQDMGDAEKRASVLTNIALQLWGQRQTDAAAAVMQQVETALRQIPSDWQAFHLRHLMQRAIAVAAYEPAIRIATAPTDPFLAGDRDIALLLLLQRAAERQNLAAADQAFLKITPENLEIRSQAMMAMATAYVNARQTDRALELRQAIHPADGLTQVRLTAAIARQLIRTGNIDPATDLFNEARTTVAALATPGDRLQAAAAVALEVANARQPVDTAMLDLVRRSAVEINDFSTSNYYLWSLVEQIVALRHYDLALQVALVTPDPDRRDMSLGTVAEAALRDGQTDRVLEVIDQSRTPERRVGLLLALVERARQDGQPQQAIAHLARALELARTIPDPEIRTFTFGNEGGTVVDDDRDRASAYEAIAIHYAQLARQAEALRVAGLIQNPQERNRVRRRVLCYRTRA